MVNRTQRDNDLWFGGPDARTLETFTLNGGAWTLLAALKDDAAVSVPPFDAISYPLEDI